MFGKRLEIALLAKKGGEGYGSNFFDSDNGFSNHCRSEKIDRFGAT